MTLDAALVPLGAIVVVAYAAQTMTGFGSQVIALSLAALLVPLDEAMPVVLALNLAVSAVVALRARAHVDLPLLLRVVVPRFGLGALLGLGVAATLGAPPRGPFGAVVLLLAGVELVRLARGRAPAPLPPPARDACLVAGGLLHGVWASGGPLVATGLSRTDLDRERLRATLVALWAPFNGLVLLSLVLRGAWTPATTAATLWLLPTIPLGIGLGELLRRSVDETGFRVALQALLVVAGLALLV